MDPEKKKLIVVGTLFVAMLGIGAFQFSKVSEGETPPPAPGAETKSPAEEKSEEKDTATKNPMYAMALPARDPFRPAPFSVTQPEAAAPVAQAPAPKVSGKPVPLPDALGGSLQPMPPQGLPDGFPGELPSPGQPQPQPQLPPAKPRFKGALIGVVVGTRSAAVFRFGSSEQVVTVGSEIAPGARLLSVSPRRATVRFHGETITIHLKDEAPASAPNPASPAPKSAPTVPSTGAQTSETPND